MTHQPAPPPPPQRPESDGVQLVILEGFQDFEGLVDVAYIPEGKECTQHVPLMVPHADDGHSYLVRHTAALVNRRREMAHFLARSVMLDADEEELLLRAMAQIGPAQAEATLQR